MKQKRRIRAKKHITNTQPWKFTTSVAVSSSVSFGSSVNALAILAIQNTTLHPSHEQIT